MISTVVTRDEAHTLGERYEQLRGAVLSRSVRAAPGLASVRRQGLWAFLELLRAADDAPPEGSSPATASPLPAPPPTVQADLIPLWVNLVLGQVNPMESL